MGARRERLSFRKRQIDITSAVTTERSGDTVQTDTTIS